MTDLPVGWADCRLSDICEINPALDRCPYPPHGDVHFVPMQAVEAESGRMDVSLLRPYSDVKKGYTAFVADDVLFAKITPCMENGKMAVVPELPASVAFGSTEFHVLRCRDGIAPHYVYQFVSNLAFRHEAEHRMTGAVGQKRVPTAFLSDHSFPLPPTREQHRIVAKIEELFSELDKAVESLTLARAQLKTYRQALLKAAFEGRLTADWRAANPDKLEPPETLLARISAERDEWYRTEHRNWEKRCREWDVAGRIGPRPARPEPHSTASPVSDKETAALTTLPADWTYTRLSEIAYVGSGVAVSKARLYEDAVEVAYLRVANVQRGHLNLSQIKTMKVERSMLPSLALRRFDVLFNEGGDRDKLGRGWVWEEAISPCITQNHVFRATLFSPTEARAKLLSHWGNTAGQDYFEKSGKQTTNLASINKTVLKALPVPLMPDSEADALHLKLEASLSQIGATEAEIEAGLAKTEALRQSILQRAFSGRLVPQDPADESASALLARLRDAPPPARTRRRKTA